MKLRQKYILLVCIGKQRIYRSFAEGIKYQKPRLCSGISSMTELLSQWRITRTTLIIIQINIPPMSLSSYRICVKEKSIRVW